LAFLVSDYFKKERRGVVVEGTPGVLYSELSRKSLPEE
jgi:hypothetical protein